MGRTITDNINKVITVTKHNILSFLIKICIYLVFENLIRLRFPTVVFLATHRRMLATHNCVATPSLRNTAIGTWALCSYKSNITLTVITFSDFQCRYNNSNLIFFRNKRIGLQIECLLLKLPHKRGIHILNKRYPSLKLA